MASSPISSVPLTASALRVGQEGRSDQHESSLYHSTSHRKHRRRSSRTAYASVAGTTTRHANRRQAARTPARHGEMAAPAAPSILMRNLLGSASKQSAAPRYNPLVAGALDVPRVIDHLDAASVGSDSSSESGGSEGDRPSIPNRSVDRASLPEFELQLPRTPSPTPVEHLATLGQRQELRPSTEWALRGSGQMANPSIDFAVIASRMRTEDRKLKQHPARNAAGTHHDRRAHRDGRLDGDGAAAPVHVAVKATRGRRHSYQSSSASVASSSSSEESGGPTTHSRQSGAARDTNVPQPRGAAAAAASSEAQALSLTQRVVEELMSQLRSSEERAAAAAAGRTAAEVALVEEHAALQATRAEAARLKEKADRRKAELLAAASNPHRQGAGMPFGRQQQRQSLTEDNGQPAILSPTFLPERTDGTGSTGGSGGGILLTRAQTEPEEREETANVRGGAVQGGIETGPDSFATEPVSPVGPSPAVTATDDRVTELERELAATRRALAVFQMEAVAARTEASRSEQAAARAAVARDLAELARTTLQSQYEALLSSHAQAVSECNIARAQATAAETAAKHAQDAAATRDAQRSSQVQNYEAEHERWARERADTQARLEALVREKAAAEAIAAEERTAARRLIEANEALAARLEALVHDIPPDSFTFERGSSESAGGPHETLALHGLNVSNISGTSSPHYHTSPTRPSAMSRHTASMTRSTTANETRSDADTAARWDSIVSRVQQLRARVAESAGVQAAMRQQRDTAILERERMGAQLEAARAAVSAAESKAAAMDAEVNSLHARLQTAQQAAAVSENEAAALQEQLSALRVRYESEIGTNAGTSASAAAANAQLQQRLDQLSRELEASRAAAEQVMLLSTALAQKQSQLAEALAKVESLRQEAAIHALHMEAADVRQRQTQARVAAMQTQLDLLNESASAEATEGATQAANAHRASTRVRELEAEVDRLQVEAKRAELLEQRNGRLLAQIRTLEATATIAEHRAPGPAVVRSMDGSSLTAAVAATAVGRESPTDGSSVSPASRLARAQATLARSQAADLATARPVVLSPTALHQVALAGNENRFAETGSDEATVPAQAHSKTEPHSPAEESNDDWDALPAAEASVAIHRPAQGPVSVQQAPAPLGRVMDAGVLLPVGITSQSSQPLAHPAESSPVASSPLELESPPATKAASPTVEEDSLPLPTSPPTASTAASLSTRSSAMQTAAGKLAAQLAPSKRLILSRTLTPVTDAPAVLPSAQGPQRGISDAIPQPDAPTTSRSMAVSDSGSTEADHSARSTFEQDSIRERAPVPKASTVIENAPKLLAGGSTLASLPTHKTQIPIGAIAPAAVGPLPRLSGLSGARQSGASLLAPAYVSSSSSESSESGHAGFQRHRPESPASGQGTHHRKASVSKAPVEDDEDSADSKEIEDVWEDYGDAQQTAHRGPHAARVQPRATSAGDSASDADSREFGSTSPASPPPSSLRIAAFAASQPQARFDGSTRHDIGDDASTADEFPAAGGGASSESSDDESKAREDTSSKSPERLEPRGIALSKRVRHVSGPLTPTLMNAAATAVASEGKEDTLTRSNRRLQTDSGAVEIKPRITSLSFASKPAPSLPSESMAVELPSRAAATPTIVPAIIPASVSPVRRPDSVSSVSSAHLGLGSLPELELSMAGSGARQKSSFEVTTSIGAAPVVKPKLILPIGATLAADSRDRTLSGASDSSPLTSPPPGIASEGKSPSPRRRMPSPRKGAASAGPTGAAEAEPAAAASNIPPPPWVRPAQPPGPPVVKAQAVLDAQAKAQSQPEVGRPAHPKPLPLGVGSRLATVPESPLSPSDSPTSSEASQARRGGSEESKSGASPVPVPRLKGFGFDASAGAAAKKPLGVASDERPFGYVPSALTARSDVDAPSSVNVTPEAHSRPNNTFIAAGGATSGGAAAALAAGSSLDSPVRSVSSMQSPRLISDVIGPVSPTPAAAPAASMAPALVFNRPFGATVQINVATAAAGPNRAQPSFASASGSASVASPAGGADVARSSGSSADFLSPVSRIGMAAAIAAASTPGAHVPSRQLAQTIQDSPSSGSTQASAASATAGLGRRQPSNLLTDEPTPVVRPASAGPTTAASRRALSAWGDEPTPSPALADADPYPRPLSAPFRGQRTDIAAVLPPPPPLPQPQFGGGAAVQQTAAAENPLFGATRDRGGSNAAVGDPRPVSAPAGTAPGPAPALAKVKDVVPRPSRELDAACAAVAALSDADLNALRGATHISDVVAVLAGAMCMLLAEKPSWKQAVALMSSHDFKERVRVVHTRPLPTRSVQIIQSLVASKGLREHVRGPNARCDPVRSPAEYVLIEWILNVCDAASAAASAAAPRAAPAVSSDGKAGSSSASPSPHGITSPGSGVSPHAQQRRGSLERDSRPAERRGSTGGRASPAGRPASGDAAPSRSGSSPPGRRTSVGAASPTGHSTATAGAAGGLTPARRSSAAAQAANLPPETTDAPSPTRHRRRSSQTAPMNTIVTEVHPPPGSSAGAGGSSATTAAAAGEAGARKSIRPVRFHDAQANALAAQLASGLAVQKFPASSSLVAFGRGTQARTLFLEQREDGAVLFWTKPGKPGTAGSGAAADDAEASSAPLREVVDVVAGMATQVVNRRGRRDKAHTYLSLVMANRTLDLELATQEERDRLLHGFKAMLASQRG